MKKLSLLVLMCVFSILSFFCLTACFNEEHQHNLVYHAKVEATCAEKGTIEYWSCDACNTNFADSSANNILEDIAIDIIKHSVDSKNVCEICGLEIRTEGLEYSLNADNESYSVIGIGTATDTEIYIPTTYNNLPVTQIGENAFAECHLLETVAISDSIINIGEAAFVSCWSLTSIKIPNSVKNIGIWAFYDCPQLTSVEIPYGITVIGETMFSGCSSLKHIEIPNSVKVIEDRAFSECSSLETIILSNIVSSIGDAAFAGCSLKSLQIPHSVTDIGYAAFAGNSLESITVDSDNTVYKSEGNCLIENSTNTLILGCKNSAIPNHVKIIGPNAFGGCHTLTKIEIPKGVKIIGEYAFHDCESLEEIIISNSVENIGDSAFRYCTLLKEIIIPDSVESIGVDSFYNCTSLTRISIGKGLKNIEEYAFSRCSNSLESITVDSDNSVYKSEGNCLIENLTNTLILGCRNSVIPSSVKHIGTGAFYACESLTNIEIPNGVESIGKTAFEHCKALTKIELPNSVTHIKGAAFWNCENLISITIGNGLEQIDGQAFEYCYSLKTINYSGTKNDWNSIIKHDMWNNYTNAYTIYCTDGEITK